MHAHDAPSIDLRPRVGETEALASRRLVVTEAEARTGLRRGVRNALPLALAFWSGVALLAGAGFVWDVVRGALVWMELVPK